MTARFIADTHVSRASTFAAWALLGGLFVLPLYPKVGLLSVPGTYIPVRPDDLIVALVTLSWIGALAVDRRAPLLSRMPAITTGVWLMVTLASLLVGAFVLQSITFVTGLAYWAKPVEYLLLAAIAYDLVRVGALPLRWLLSVVLASAAIVVGYALLERIGVVPHLPGLVPPPGAVTSTFGDLHELAAYLGIISIVGVALWHQVAGSRARLLALVAILAMVPVMYATAARTEYAVLIVALLLVAFWRPARLPATVCAAALVFLLVSPFATSALSNMLTPPPPPGPIVTPDPNAPPPPPIAPPPPDTNVSTRLVDFSLGASWDYRMNIKWPALLNAAMRDPVLGLGPSAATEAADGYYVRSFVESGLVGLTAFLALVAAIFLSLRRAARAPSGLVRSLALAMLGATFFVAGVGVLIDTWVASRVMELYWPLLGATLAAAPLAPADFRRSPAIELAPA